MSDIRRILDFWLEEVGPEGWWQPDPALDRKVRSRFIDLWDDAMAGGLFHWTVSAEGALALVLLLDQFPRNIFRGQGAAYRSDGLARRVAKGAIARGLDLEVPEPGRLFFYLPLEHAESIEDQERCIRLMMLRLPEMASHCVPHAVKHREVIRRFGRFPSRNAALGRRDTAAERSYRARGGYMSGAPGAGPGRMSA